MNNEDEIIGAGATTLDWLIFCHPWLKQLLEEKDRKIKELEDIIWNSTSSSKDLPDTSWD